MRKEGFETRGVDPDGIVREPIPERDPARAGVEIEGEEPERLQRSIEHTRAEMSETIDEIQHRLSPSYLKEQIKDSVRESARGASSTMIDTIKENPIPALIAGLSIAWLFRKGTTTPSHRQVASYRGDYEYPVQRRYREEGYGGYAGTYRPSQEDHGRSIKDRASDVADRAGEAAHRVMDRAGEMGDSVRERASEVTHQAWDQVEHLSDRAQYQAHRMGDRFDRMLHENPLAVGAIAFAAGAAIGLAVPETHAEDQWMGEKRDQLVDRVKDVAEEKLEKVQHVAEKTLGAAEKTISAARETVTDTMKQGARDEGLLG